MGLRQELRSNICGDWIYGNYIERLYILNDYPDHIQHTCFGDTAIQINKDARFA